MGVRLSAKFAERLQFARRFVAEFTFPATPHAGIHAAAELAIAGSNCSVKGRIR